MARFVTNEYKLDITPQGNYPVVYLSQFENGRQIKFIMMNRGKTLSIPSSGISVTISGIKSNGGYYEHICTFESNNVLVPVESDMTDVSGRGVATIVFTDGDGDTVISAKFIINVQEGTSDGGVEVPTAAETILQQILAEIRAEASKLDLDMEAIDFNIEQFKSDVSDDVSVIGARLDNFLSTQAGVSNGMVIEETTLFELSSFTNLDFLLYLSDDPRDYDYLKIDYGLYGYDNRQVYDSYGEMFIKPDNIINTWWDRDTDIPSSDRLHNFLRISFSRLADIQDMETGKVTPAAQSPEWNDTFVIQIFRSVSTDYTHYEYVPIMSQWNGSSNTNTFGECYTNANAVIKKIVGIKFVPAGTNKDPELADIRVSADGTTYTTAGAAVRALEDKVDNQSITISGTGLFIGGVVVEEEAQGQETSN